MLRGHPWRYIEAVKIVSGTCTCQPECPDYEAEVGDTLWVMRKCEGVRLGEMFPELDVFPEGYERLTGTDG